ncbi:hypothetical protein PHLGIDRAFT_32715 [Phlebiopsis gigantea 11061_1 CR5-6]|uniref:Uncharacterized protein n=1 Tax=Phlebiopsis gigantea (strain 11061_1 CR5-6) TaxID=745531 RepID=A0A0C3SEL6_PHLG1|nr:hypothetical protein PHLGIDRAFT_32715 [Phlebiopsis gigantea 11061_1 CR5-6]
MRFSLFVEVQALSSEHYWNTSTLCTITNHVSQGLLALMISTQERGNISLACSKPPPPLLDALLLGSYLILQGALRHTAVLVASNEDMSGEDTTAAATQEASGAPPAGPAIIDSAAFHDFERQIIELDKELRQLSNASRQLGSSVAEDLPDELIGLAKDIGVVLDCFSQYPEFLDEVPGQSLEKDIEGWANYLHSFTGKHAINTQHASLINVHQTTLKRQLIGKRLQPITVFIPMFIKVGIPTIRGAQKGSATNLVNLSTVAALFSGVTATMIQFSYQANSTTLEDAVNGFWFISLVFSISAAVNSLLGLTWMQAVLPRLVCIRIKPAAMSVWFAFERWIFDWHNGNKLLSDVLSEVAHGISQFRLIAWLLDQYHRAAAVNRRVVQKGSPALQSLKKLFIKLLYSEDASLDQASTMGDPAPSTYTAETRFVMDIEAQSPIEGDVTTPSEGLIPSAGNEEHAHPTTDERYYPASHQTPFHWNVRSQRDNATRNDYHACTKAKDLGRYGKFLVTTGWDKRTTILGIHDNFAIKDSLSHTSGFVGQIEWSPSGRLLLTKSNHVIRLWEWDEAESKMRPRPFVRKLPVEAIQWLPDSQSFLSVEEENAVKIVVIRYTVDGMALSDVAVTHDAHWMLCVGTVVSDLKPSEEGSGMSQIISCERVPSRNVVIASDDTSVLVSFEDRVSL